MYFNEIEQNNKIFSLDMLRLHFKLKQNETLITMFQKYLTIELMAEYYYSFRSFNYKTLYEIEGLKIGLYFNGKDREDCFKGFIEFNPNKQNLIFKKIKPYLNEVAYNYVVHTYDLAVDLRLPRANVFFLKDRRDYRFFEKYISATSQYSLTEYLGKRNNNGFCKLYNKGAESNLDYDLTRFEITLNELNFANLQKQLPTIQYFDNNFLTDLNGVTLELVRMCYQYNDYSALNFLNFRTKEKIKDTLKLSTFDFPVSVFRDLKAQVLYYKNY